MKRLAILASSALVLVGCATQPVDVTAPIELIGMVTNPIFTGWSRDFCEEENLPTGPIECVQIGGEIYKVTLLNARTLDGRRISQKLIIGFPAHALPATYREKKRLRLEKSPDDFRIATGIEYMAWDWSDT